MVSPVSTDQAVGRLDAVGRRRPSVWPGVRAQVMPAVELALVAREQPQPLERQDAGHHRPVGVVELELVHDHRSGHVGAGAGVVRGGRG